MHVRHQAARPFIHVEAHDGGKEVLIYALRVVIGVVGAALVAEGHVEIAIRAEVQVAGIMVGRFIELYDVARLRTRVSLVGIGGRDLIAGQNVMPSATRGRDRGARVKDVKETVDGISRMERQPE